MAVLPGPIPRLVGFGASGASASYIGSAANQTSSSVTWPSGTQADDLAVITGFGNTYLTGSGLSYLTAKINNSPSNHRTGWKVLTSGNISSYTVTVPTNGAYMIHIFRGADTVAQKQSFASAFGGTKTHTGFTKHANSQFVMTLGVDRDANALTHVGGDWTDGANGVATYFGHCASLIESSGYDEGSVVQDLHFGAYGAGGEFLEMYNT